MKSSAKLNPVCFYNPPFWLLAVFFALLCDTCAFGSKVIMPAKSALTNENWLLHSEVKGIKVYYQISAWEKIRAVYLKFDRTNLHPVRISWQETYIT